MKEFLTKHKDEFYLAAAIIASVLFYFAPISDTLTMGENVIPFSHEARITMSLLIFAIVLWVTEAIPFVITSLIVMILIPLLGATEGLEVVRNGDLVAIHGAADGLKEMILMGFGNRLIFFFMGVFLLSAAFIQSGLGDRLTLYLLLLVGTGTKIVILGFLVMGSLLSMWITDMAVAALLTPLAVSILRSADIKPLESKFGTALLIACCWGAVFGGIATPAGCGPNPIAIEYLKNLTGIHISFLDWMMIGVPLTACLIPFGWVVLLLLFPPEMKRIPLERKRLKERLTEKGGFQKAEIVTLVVFLTVIALWVGSDLIKKLTDGGLVLSMEMVALAGGLVFFLPGVRVMTWKEAEPLMNWGAIVLVMASLSLGLMMYETGAARWLSWVLLGRIQGISPLIQIGLVVAAVIVMKLFLASNTVTGIIVIPLLITLAQDMGLDAWFLVAPAAFTASLGIILLTQSPTNIIPHTSGYFTAKDFALSGAVMSVIMVLVLTIMIPIGGRLTGIYTF